VDLVTLTVFIDSTRQGNAWVPAAGPLLDRAGRVAAHVYAGHAYVTVIFNEQVALTTVVEPSGAPPKNPSPKKKRRVASPCDKARDVLKGTCKSTYLKSFRWRTPTT